MNYFWGLATRFPKSVLNVMLRYNLFDARMATVLRISILDSMCAAKVLAEAISIQSKCYLHQTCGVGMEYQKG